MGSTQTRGQGGMIISFDQPYYYPGDLVTGSIYLNIFEAFDTKGLELRLKIKESVKWKETEYKTEKHSEWNETTKSHQEVTRTNPVTVWRKDDATLFQNSTVMATMINNVFGIGQYCYPFLFYLLQNLPVSFEYYDHDVSACIKYEVRARTISWQEKKELELETINIIVVRQSPQNFQYPTNLSDTRQISTWCFLSKGSSTLNVSYYKNNFLQNEIVQVICQLNNTNCRLNCNCVKLQLFQRINLKAKGHHHHTHSDTKYLTRTLAERRQPGNYVAGQETMTTLKLVKMIS